MLRDPAHHNSNGAICLIKLLFEMGLFTVRFTLCVICILMCLNKITCLLCAQVVEHGDEAAAVNEQTIYCLFQDNNSYIKHLMRAIINRYPSATDLTTQSFITLRQYSIQMYLVKQNKLYIKHLMRAINNRYPSAAEPTTLSFLLRRQYTLLQDYKSNIKHLMRAIIIRP